MAICHVAFSRTPRTAFCAFEWIPKLEVAKFARVAMAGGAPSWRAQNTKTEMASLKGDSIILLKERDDERQRVKSLQLQLETANVSRQVASADLDLEERQKGCTLWTLLEKSLGRRASFE